MAGQCVLHRAIGNAVYGDGVRCVAQRRQRHQPDGRPDQDPEIFGGLSPYFDVTAFRSVTDVRFGTARYNSLRGPGVANLDLSLFRTFALKRNMTLQLRVEALNATNTPHFANPASNVANLQLNPDGTVGILNGFGVITSTNRLGVRRRSKGVMRGLTATGCINCHARAIPRTCTSQGALRCTRVASMRE